MRLNWRQALPSALEAMLGVEQAANAAGGDLRLLNLIKIRASQINGCAYCVRLHAREARALGESQERLEMIAVWRVGDCFTDAERAALDWCEALTLLPSTGAPDDSYEGLRRHFDEQQTVALTLAIVAINGWNRLNVGFRTPASAADAVPLPPSR